MLCLYYNSKTKKCIKYLQTLYFWHHLQYIGNNILNLKKN